MIDRPRLHPLVSLVLAVAIGLLIGAGQAPMGVWPATLAGVALFTWLMAELRGRAAFGWGYLVGLALNTLTVAWVSVLGVWVAVAVEVGVGVACCSWPTSKPLNDSLARTCKINENAARR